MNFFTIENRNTLKVIIPFAIAGYVFYSAYAKKGKTDWQNAGMMSLIVFFASYIVVSQTGKLMANTFNNNQNNY